MDEFQQNQKIAASLAELEREIPDVEKRVRIHKQIKPYGNVIMGNRAGLLKFGVQSIKTAMEPHTDFKQPIKEFTDESLDELQADELEPFAFWRDDQVRKLTLAESREESRIAFKGATRIGMSVFIILITLFLFVGVFTSVRFLLDQF